MKNMKKWTYFVVGLLILGSFAAISIGEAGINEKTLGPLQFAEPQIKEKIIDRETYVQVTIDGAPGAFYQSGKPTIPFYTTTINLPFGSKIADIECTTSEVETLLLEDKILPAPTSVPYCLEEVEVEYKMDESIYNSEELFPDNWFEYYTGAGLDTDDIHKTFLTIRVYPVRYSPAADTIYYIDDLNLKITYEEPESYPFPENGQYDMVVIGPSNFLWKFFINKLVKHKNNVGVKTLFKTTKEIYKDYTGVDKPEQIKYFIKDALDTWDIKYVLLIGGMKSRFFGRAKDDRNQGTRDWYVPVRYTNVRDSGSTYDPGFISDLYYADIYDSGGGFSSWDSNADGIFAKWDNTPGKDIIDLYPDVYVGRLACRNFIELNTVVNKIIKYEKTTYGQDWYDDMLVVAGDSHNDIPYGTNYLEGELVTEEVLTKYMTGFNPVRLYASYKTSNPSYTPTTPNIIREITAGPGHLFFEGHANPGSWNTHWPYPGGGWTGGITLSSFKELKNGNKLPVCVVGGCHNSQFNVTALSTYFDTDNSKHTWCYGGITIECWSWWLVRLKGGGTIATIGNSGLGYGAIAENGDLDGDGNNQPDCMEALGGYQGIQFYKTFDEGIDILGEVWGGTTDKYLNTFPGMAYQLDAKTVEQWPLLGDPSLKIGGYP